MYIHLQYNVGLNVSHQRNHKVRLSQNFHNIHFKCTCSRSETSFVCDLGSLENEVFLHKFSYVLNLVILMGEKCDKEIENTLPKYIQWNSAITRLTGPSNSPRYRRGTDFHRKVTPCVAACRCISF